MSDSPLPDDLARWPTNPYQLLGVPSGVGSRELKRAYHRLIRIYKPEQSPEEFRRIRAAFESLQRYAELFDSPDEPVAIPAEQLPLPKLSLESADESSEWADRDSRPRQQSRSLEDDLEELWTCACEGQPEVAYQRLLELQRQYTSRTEVYLRLYWLLTLFPDLNPGQEARHWLVEGLVATGLSGPLRELYREEVAADPTEALSERYKRLLHLQVPVGVLTDLAEWRFTAADQLGHLPRLAEEVRKLRLRFGPSEDQQWVRLLLSLADRLAWTNDAATLDLLEVCRTEIVRNDYLASSLSYAYDRFDLLLSASAGWRLLQRQGFIPAEFLQLLAHSWYRPFEDLRGQLETLLKEIENKPRLWLENFDVIHKHAPITLSLFHTLLNHVESSRETAPVPPCDDRYLIRMVQSLLARLRVNKYTQDRREVLIFCLTEWISPEEIAEVASNLASNWAPFGAAWAHVLNTDWPLRHVYRACQLSLSC